MAKRRNSKESGNSEEFLDNMLRKDSNGTYDEKDEQLDNQSPVKGPSTSQKNKKTSSVSTDSSSSKVSNSSSSAKKVTSNEVTNSTSKKGESSAINSMSDRLYVKLNSLDSNFKQSNDQLRVISKYSEDSSIFLSEIYDLLNLNDRDKTNKRKTSKDGMQTKAGKATGSVGTIDSTGIGAALGLGVTTLGALIINKLREKIGSSDTDEEDLGDDNQSNNSSTKTTQLPPESATPNAEPKPSDDKSSNSSASKTTSDNVVGNDNFSVISAIESMSNILGITLDDINYGIKNVKEELETINKYSEDSSIYLWEIYSLLDTNAKKNDRKSGDAEKLTPVEGGEKTSESGGGGGGGGGGGLLETLGTAAATLAARRSAVAAAKRATALAAAEAAGAGGVSKWAKFLKFLEKRSPKLFAKVATRLLVGGAGLALPGPGWIWTAITVLGSLSLAWDVYQLWQEFSNTQPAGEDAPPEVKDELNPDVSTDDMSPTNPPKAPIKPLITPPILTAPPPDDATVVDPFASNDDAISTLTDSTTQDTTKTNTENKQDLVDEFAKKMGLPGSDHKATMQGGVPIEIDGVAVPENLYSADQLKMVNASRQLGNMMNGGKNATPNNDATQTSSSNTTVTPAASIAPAASGNDGYDITPASFNPASATQTSSSNTTIPPADTMGGNISSEESVELPTDGPGGLAEKFGPIWSKLESEYGLPSSYMQRMAKIESNFDPNAYNPSGAAGLFQFMPKTAKEYGLSDPYDPMASSQAAAALASNNSKSLQRKLNRQPTSGELYLAHQQGATGAAKLLKDPDAMAVDVIGKQRVIQNGGSESMTTGQFAGLWTSKFGGSPATSAGSKPEMTTASTGASSTESAVVESSSGVSPTAPSAIATAMGAAGASAGSGSGGGGETAIATAMGAADAPAESGSGSSGATQVASSPTGSGTQDMGSYSPVDAVQQKPGDSAEEDKDAAGGLTTIRTASGKTTQVGEAYASNLQGFITDLEATGYQINSLGGYANRANVNNPSVKSYHAMGAAIDINPEQNPNNSTKSDLPPETGALAAKHGLGWGMNWKSVKDPMHFSAAKSEQGSFDIKRGSIAPGEVQGGAAPGGGGNSDATATSKGEAGSSTPAAGGTKPSGGIGGAFGAIGKMAGNLIGGLSKSTSLNSATSAAAPMASAGSSGTSASTGSSGGGSSKSSTGGSSNPMPAIDQMFAKLFDESGMFA